MNKIRFGIIGAGGIAAKMHLPEIAQASDRAAVTLIAGRKESRLKILCERFGVARFTQKFDDVIADDQVDAVIVATPHPMHVEWGLKALAAGKHVFMQKPLCEKMAEADAFVEAADRHPRRTVVCLPHFPDIFHTVREQILRGSIGKPSGGHARTSHGGPEVYYREVAALFGEGEPTDLWFFDASRAGVGALFDMGVYAVAHLVAMLGSMRRVTASITTVDKPTTLEDTATVIMESQNGALATAQTSWCDPGRTWEFSIHGSTGKYVFPGASGADATRFVPQRLDADNAPIDAIPVSASGKVGTATSHFLDCIETGIQPPLSNARAARHVTEILLASLTSARERRAVDLNTTL